MRLPPEPPDDPTPPESSIKTIDISTLKTRSFVTAPTIDLGSNKTQTYLIDTGKISLGTLVRARQGGHQSGTDDADRKYKPLLVLAFRKGFTVGAAVTLGLVTTGFGLSYVVTRWKVIWPAAKSAVSWIWHHAPWKN